MALQPGAIAKERSGRRRILLVEDEPFVREATCSILQNAGFEVLPAENASEAMKVYEECGRRVDLVMTDMVLPGRTGQQLGQDLRQRSPEVAVLVTSGYGEAAYETESPEAHTYFLAKPYSRRGLVEKIETILETGSLGRAATQAG
jgi:two-component system cell cycle sensor histidine kinase/response regulator CckA